VILYTFQDIAAYKAAKKLGYFTCSAEWSKKEWNRGTEADFWDWIRPAYEYMVEQMAKRIPNFSGEYPIWAYAWKIDLRHFRHEYNSELILFKIDVPEERLILSCMDGWNFVMNGSYFSLSEEEDLRIHGVNYDKKPSKRAIRKSWERIFDRDSKADPDWLGPTRDFQACCDRVYLDEIVSMRQLKPWGKGQK
jgi:hypothetical protein